MPAPAPAPEAPKTELQELQIKANEVTDEVSTKLICLFRYSFLKFFWITLLPDL